MSNDMKLFRFQDLEIWEKAAYVILVQFVLLVSFIKTSHNLNKQIKLMKQIKT